MAFHFLNKALHGDEHAGGGVFGFLANAGKAGVATATGNHQAQQNAVQGLQSSGLIQADKKIIGMGVDAASKEPPGHRKLLYAPEPRQVMTPIKSQATRLPAKNFSGHSPFGFLDDLYGDVQTYQQRTEGNKKVIEGSRFRGVAGPASILSAGLTIGGDVTGFGGTKKGAGELAQDLAKASSAKDAHKALVQSGVEDSLAHKIAPAVAHTKDPNIIKNIIDNAHKPPAPPPSPIQDIRPL
jgi:hypothetical protein